MNIKKIISMIPDKIQKLSTEGIKDITTHIVNHIINTKTLFVCDGTFYLYSQNLLIVISDKETSTVIRCLISSANRAEVSSFIIKEAIERLRDMSEVQIDIDEIMKQNRYKILLTNGVFDVKNNQFNSATKKDLFLYRLNFEYVSGCTIDNAPTFKGFVETSLGTENLDCLLEWLGYSCTTLTDARKSMFLIGPEQCGKSVLLDVIEEAIGTENTSSVSFSNLGTEQSKIKYQGKIVNLSRETSAEPMKNDDAFKIIASGDKTTGRRLYENSKEFRLFIKLITASNFFPQFKHMDTATLDRIVAIYFNDRVESNVKTDFQLKEKLIVEKDVIFSMALDRTAELIKSGYQFSISERAKNVLKNKHNELLNISEFIKENFELDTDAVISSTALYQQYKEWCNINAIAPEGRNTFYSKVTDYSNTIIRGKFIIENRNLNGFRGLKIKCEYNDNKYVQAYQDSHSSTQKEGENR